MARWTGSNTSSSSGPARIRLAYRGATGVSLNPVLSEAEGEAGQLEVTTPLGGFTDDTPVAYQEIDGQRAEVPVAYFVGQGSSPWAFDIRCGA